MCGFNVANSCNITAVTLLYLHLLQLRNVVISTYNATHEGVARVSWFP